MKKGSQVYYGCAEEASPQSGDRMWKQNLYIYEYPKPNKEVVSRVTVPFFGEILVVVGSRAEICCEIFRYSR